jgi:membrane protein DedA with SNARE-associated domain
MRYAVHSMGQHIFELLRGYLVHYGYWTIAAALLLENAGIPVPGETILLLASFLAFSEQRLRLPLIVLIGSCAAIMGDNCGYWLGYAGGRRLLEQYRHLPHLRRTLQRCEELFQRYGAFTIFFARFIAGLRIVAGPMAGVSRMSWEKFAFWNCLGAVTWVTAISLVGFFVGRSWDYLLQWMRGMNIAVALVAAVIVALVWWRRRRENLPGSD